VLGAEAEIGQVAPGYRGDLLLLDADPLADIRNTRRIHAVIQGGVVIDRERLRGVAASGLCPGAANAATAAAVTLTCVIGAEFDAPLPPDLQAAFDEDPA
jgi:cytosine/adenosine deaminase-related metal-dependent hydrolase